MASVSSRARSVKQPRGGYLKPSQFKVVHIEDGKILNEDENISGSVIGMAVDYLTRFMLGASAEDAFSISLLGASIAQKEFGIIGTIATANRFLNRITGIDDESIIYACKLAAFDVWSRDPYAATLAKGCNEINPDELTIHNIQVLVQRCIAVFSEYGPVIKYEFTFEPEKEDEDDYEYNYNYYGQEPNGGYTGTVDSGDGDYLTKDTLWDLKVLKSKLTSKHTLQLIMYWIMGQHSGQNVFKNISKIGIFNPRLNNIYSLDVKDIPVEVIQAVEDDVICYKSKFVLREADSGICYDLKASNGDTIASSKVYASKSACKKGIETFKKVVTTADVEDQTTYDFKKVQNPKIEIYRNSNRMYSYRIKGENGVIIATGNEYKKIAECKNDIARIRKYADSADIE